MLAQARGACAEYPAVDGGARKIGRSMTGAGRICDTELRQNAVANGVSISRVMLDVWAFKLRSTALAHECGSSER